MCAFFAFHLLLAVFLADFCLFKSFTFGQWGKKLCVGFRVSHSKFQPNSICTHICTCLPETFLWVMWLWHCGVVGLLGLYYWWRVEFVALKNCIKIFVHHICSPFFFFGFGFVFGFFLAVDKIIFLLTDLSRYLVFKFKKPQNLSVWFQQLLYLSAGLWAYRYVCEVVAHNLLVEGIKAFIFVPYLLL